MKSHVQFPVSEIHSRHGGGCKSVYITEGGLGYRPSRPSPGRLEPEPFRKPDGATGPSDPWTTHSTVISLGPWRDALMWGAGDGEHHGLLQAASSRAGSRTLPSKEGENPALLFGTARPATWKPLEAPGSPASRDGCWCVWEVGDKK